MQGNDEMVANDVRGIGNSIGIKIKGDNENMFNVLSRASKGNKGFSGQQVGGGARKEKGGLEGLEKRKEVCKLVGDLTPSIICLQETKMQTCDDFLCSTLWGNSPHAFSYRPSVGASVGLLTLWDSSEVEVWSTESREHVLWCHGRFTKSGEEFFVVNVYAPCNDGAKQGLWDSLTTRIHSLGRRRVCVCGDFNAVKHIDERRSSRGSSRSLDHVPFNRFIDDNNLIDLPLSGRKFTWFKGDDLSMSRLDRLRGISDHCALVLSADEEDWGPRPSRMLKCCRDVPGYNQFVRDKWNSLQVDGWGGYPNREEEIADLHEVTSDIYSLSRMNAGISWQQFRSLWLKEGDANSRYFHSVLASRRRGNAVSVLHVDGVTLEGVTPIRQAVLSHLASHFKVINVERPGVDHLQFKRLTQIESSSLTKPFSEDEVKSAVWDCDSYKSPDSPQRLNDFRPISLVGSLYKILAKVLANRLRQVIGSVISKSQTAFVKDRKILDGILIANEAVDEARKSKKELMLFKVDFEKAYDSVDWGYLDNVMGRMSFLALWRKWIKECVCTATASVLVNGSPTNEFPLERGLRQGDPLSPFLFLLAAEGLHVLMEAVVDRHLFTGYSISERDPVSVSHLQFADDTLLMGVKSWANVRPLRAVLVLFETMSGLKVNFNKSSLVGVNIPDSWLCEAASALCCKEGKIPFLYLGLPIGGGDPRRLSFWEPVLDRLKNRLSGWKSRFLSFGGRLVLLKAVLTSLPVYALSFFKAPSGKWCWRMLVDREGLWYRVLVARYGVEGGRHRDGGQRGSSWWREITRIREGGRGAWEWRRQLRVWEEEVMRECQSLLLNFSLQARSSDRWQWQPDPDIGYTVSIFAWRLLHDRLPTKANLVTHGILSPADGLCVCGCGAAESAQHLFLSCSTFGSIWASGSLAFGLCGRKETTDCSGAQQAALINCWTRSSFLLLGG
ncbi:hypothetical protein TSUD_139160 [Trifolium subterraneum]|uniref:Reverse transcriptase domain-containing protein n=1 Tax=Trifolium subterraneum TaxID=3900 RepID=A0A2Z6NYD0_TRISU|nr:hypothetical protein TSUD_139160 [Trifolium subterraneum]